MIYPQKDRPTPTRRLLGAQVLVFRSRDYHELRQAMLDLKKAGVNTVMVRAFQNPGDRIYPFADPRYQIGAYFKTTHAPVVDPVLGRIVSIAHGIGLRVFAWLETRKMPLHLPAPKKSKALSYSFETATYKHNAMWSIFDETVHGALVGLFYDAARSGVDGILIQDDLIMYRHEDFNPKAVSLFEAKMHRQLDPKELFQDVFTDQQGRWCVGHYSNTFWAWARWKNQKLLQFAMDLIRSAKAANPEIEIAMNFMYESLTAPKNALAWMSQSLAEAVKLPIDYYAIMAYHRQMRHELELSQNAAYNKISTMTAQALALVNNPHRILMKVQMTDWKTRKAIPPDEAGKVFQLISDQGEVSLAFIPYCPSSPLNVIGGYYRQ
ncbi:MAG: family 10 glycosylhydrolase [Deltaproteobacteria bacterium]|nr:family 10 glycosylhydrolase [Deltaproteobacteria bacterium]